MFSQTKTGLKAVLETNNGKQITNYLQTVHMDEVRQCLENKEFDVNATFGKRKSTLLMGAVYCGRADIVEILLKKYEADPNLMNKDGYAAIHFTYALKDKPTKETIIDALLKNGGDPDAKLESGATLLMYACQCGEAEIVDALLKHKADPNLVDGIGQTALNYIVFIKDRDKKTEIERLLKARGAKKHSSQPIKVMRALGYADIFDSFGVCYGMASAGIDYMKRGKDGIKEIDELLLALGDDDTDAVVDKINRIQEFRTKFVNENQARIKENIEDDLFNELRKWHESKAVEKEKDYAQKKVSHWEDPALFALLYEALIKKMEPEKANDAIYAILDGLVKSQFTDTTENERKDLIQNIIKSKLRGEPVSNPKQVENVLKMKRFRNNAWKSIYQEMLEGLINVLVQKQLDIWVRNALEQDEQFKNDAVLLDAPNYLQSILISQSPTKFKQYFEKNIPFAINTQNVFITFPLVSSMAAEKQGLAAPSEGSFSGSYSKTELKKVFGTWQAALEKQNIENPVAFMLCSKLHAISIAYLPKEKEWALNGYLGVATITTQDKEVLGNWIFDRSDPLNSIVPASLKSERIDIEGRVYSTKKDERKIHSAIISINSDLDEKLHTLSETKVKTGRDIKAGVLFAVGLVCVTLAITAGAVGGPILFILGAVLAAVTVGYGRLIYDSLFASPEQQNEAVRANAERDAGCPTTTSRQRIQQGLENKNKQSSSNEEEKMPLLETYDEGALEKNNEAEFGAISSRLFTKKHSDFLALQKDWRNIKKPLFFDPSRLLGYHQHYKNIEAIFDQNHGKYCPEKGVYQKELNTIHRELGALLKAPLLKYNIPHETHIKLIKIYDHVDSLLKEKQPPNKNSLLIMIR
jgi:uncharacterized protein